MADGQSTGPATTPPVTPAESVVQPGSFDLYLSSEIETLHLANNHKIKDLVDRYNEAVAPSLEILENQYALPDHERVGGPMNFDSPDISPEAIDARRANAEVAAAQLSDQLESDIERELQNVADAVYELATLMNGSNSTAQGIRDDINRIDAEVTALEAELAVVTPKIVELRQTYRNSGPEAATGFLAETFQAFDAAGIVPPSISQPTMGNPLNSIDVGSWSYYLGLPVRGLEALEVKAAELEAQIEHLGNQYPDVYKNYTKLLNGFSLSERSIDWWKIGSTVASWAISEAIWIAAGFALAPLTGGIATALIASTRMVSRAGKIGAHVAAGLTASGRAIVWLYNLPDRVTDFAINAFKNAWGRVRARVAASRGQPASQVNGRGQEPDAPTCPIGACRL